VAHGTTMTKIGTKYNQQCITSQTHTEPDSDHATIRRTTTTPETLLPEYTKAIVLQKIKAYEEKQSKQALQ
jgi:hypothetical protein